MSDVGERSAAALRPEDLRSRRGRAFVWLAAVALLVAGFCFFGCSRTEPRGSSSTGAIVTPAEIRIALPDAADLLGRPIVSTFLGDAAYAQVSSTWLRAYYDQFRAEIFRQGVTKWDQRYDCNHFAGYYVALAQTRFYLEHFHSRTPAQTLALGVFWYRSPQGPHAIVAAFTERGLLFIEPQTGQELELAPAQRASAWLKAF